MEESDAGEGLCVGVEKEAEKERCSVWGGLERRVESEEGERE